MHVKFPSLDEQWVIDIGYVAHALHRAARVHEPTNQHVISNERECVPEMSCVIWRHTTHVHLHVVARREVNDLSPRGIE